MGEFVSSVVVVPLAICLTPFIFYGLGAGLGSGASSSLWLRGKGLSLPLLASDATQQPQPQWQDSSPIDVGVPSCAKDVWVTLHKEIGGKKEHACRGLLLRDDLLVTSRECARFEFTFRLPGAGIVEAAPHTSLNAKEGMAGSKLGFLKARSPNHYIFLDVPVRRSLVFLSHQTNPIIEGATNHTSPVFTCADKYKPIAHSFPIDGEMVPLGILADVVPNDVLWEHQDLDTATMLSHKKHRWFARPIALKEEERRFQRLLDSERYRGPPGSVSIPDAHTTFATKASNLCEAVDPRGHRHQDCFANYFTRWREEEPFSGQHFFDWLDFGDGKWLLEKNDRQSNKLEYRKHDERCFKSIFNRMKVHYFTNKERRSHKVYITPSEDGTELIARYTHNDELVPESEMPIPENDEGRHPGHLYMWDMSSQFYIVDNTWDTLRRGPIKHTGVLDGRPALSAGKVYVGARGVVRGIDWKSGHYKPDIQAPSIMFTWMQRQGFNTSALSWLGWVEDDGSEYWSREYCDQEYVDWENIDLPGYDANALKQTCYELTTSPTWMLETEFVG